MKINFFLFLFFLIKHAKENIQVNQGIPLRPMYEPFLDENNHQNTNTNRVNS